MIIAVDGPAASGKGTIARALAKHYGLPHLDTGLLYRAVGVSVARSNGDPDNEADALKACGFADDLLADPALRSEEAGPLASRVSRHPAVRAALLERQRAFANQPGGVGQRHDRAGAGQTLWPAASRHRPALSGRRRLGRACQWRPGQ